MNRKLNLLAIMATMALMAHAEHVTPSQALSQAKQFCQTQVAKGVMRAPQRMSDMKLAHTGDNDTYYAFNRGDGAGYVIVAGDDCSPTILGYSSKGNFDYDSMPANMKAWLKGYEQQVAASAALGIKYEAPAKADSRKKVAQMLTSQWGQHAPYNGMCPESSTGSGNAVTGCVATAMAQVARYHQWPAKASGTGSATYNGSAVASIDMSNDTFEWDKMLDKYASSTGTESSGTTEQRNAVALLMRDMGYSVNMSYTDTASSASTFNIAPALVNNFNYDKATHFESRTWSTDAEWDDIIYNEVANGRPVLYCGFTKINEGHEFVCDGYAGDGYYHFNWGWNGLADDNFLLSALNPKVHGTGGSAYQYAFDYKQSIIVGTQKPVDGSDYTLQMAQVGNFTYDAENDLFYTYFANYSIVSIDGYFGIKVVNQNTLDTTHVVLGAGNLGSNRYFQRLNGDKSTYADGIYKINLAFSPDKGTTWIDGRGNTTYNTVLYMVVKNGKRTYYTEAEYASQTVFTAPEPLKVTNLDSDDKFNLSNDVVGLGIKINNVNGQQLTGYQLTVTHNGTTVASPTYTTADEAKYDGNIITLEGNYATSDLGITEPGTYTITISAYKDNQAIAITPADNASVTFEAKKNSTGITDAEASAQVTASKVYNLQGICMAEQAGKANLNGLPAGIYIVRSTLSNGTVTVAKKTVR